MTHSEPLPESAAAMHLRTQREDVAVETTAMAAAYGCLQPLGEDARFRAITWLTMALDLPAPRWGRRPHTEDVPF
jgi:hypothetical protein